MFGIGKLRERISSLELELGVQRIKHLEHVTLSNQRHKKAMKLAGYEPIKELIKKNWDGKECHKPFKITSEDGKNYEIRSSTKNGCLCYQIYMENKLQIQTQIIEGGLLGLLKNMHPYNYCKNVDDKQFSDDEYFKEVGK